MIVKKSKFVKSMSAFGEFPGPHPAEQIQTLLHGTIPVRRDGRVGQIAPIFLELLRSQLADVGKSFLDQLFGILIRLLKII